MCISAHSHSHMFGLLGLDSGRKFLYSQESSPDRPDHHRNPSYAPSSHVTELSNFNSRPE